MRGKLQNGGKACGAKMPLHSQCLQTKEEVVLTPRPSHIVIIYSSTCLMCHHVFKVKPQGSKRQESYLIHVYILIAYLSAC